MPTKIAADAFGSYDTSAGRKLAPEDFNYLGRERPVEQPSYLNELGIQAKKVGLGIASFGAATADLLVGAPEALGGTIDRRARENKLIAAGVPEHIAKQQAASEQPPMVGSPIQRLTSKLGVPVWDQSGVAALTEKAMEGAAEATGLPARDLGYGLELAMGAGGVTGLRAAAKAATVLKTPGQGWENVSPEARAVEEQARAQETAGARKASAEATAAAEAANPPFRQQMPEPLTKAERSARTAESAKRVKEAFKKDPETADYWKYLEDERLQENYRPLVDQAMKEGRRYEKPAYDELMLKAKDAMAKPGFLQTAQDKLVIKEALRERAIDFTKMGKFGEMGKIDPQLQKIIAGVAIGTAIGAAAVPSLWEFLDEHVKPTVNRWKHSDEREQFFQDRVKELEKKAGEYLSPEAVEQLREDFIQKRWNPQAPAGEQKNWTLNEALVGGGLLASTALGPKSAMGVLREASPYGSKVLERLGQNKIDFGRQEVQQELSRADVSKADREVFSEILKEHPGERIPADTLVKEFQLKKGPVNMYGKADPQLLMTVGGAATGAVLGSIASDDPLFGGITGSLIGAALSLPKGRAVIGDVAKGADYLGGMISTRILHKAPALYKVMHDLDRGELTRAGNYMSRVVPWLTESVNLSKEQKTLLNTGIFMKDMKTLADVNEGNPKLVAGWREVQNLLRETGEQAKGLGRFKELNAEYFPQRVKDYKGLMGHLGSEVKTRLETLIKDAETRATKQNRVFTDTERDALINAELRKTYKPSSYLPSYAKDRKIQQVTEDLQKFYYTPQQALVISLGEVARDLELAKAFGKDLVQSKHEGKSYINVDLSVGNVVGRLMKEGKLDAEAQLELESLLKSRLGPGERSPHHLLTDVQALGYMATLNDVVATAVQLGDPLKVAYTQGPRATMTAIARKFSGRSHITAEEFHLSDHIAQELAAGSTSSVPLKRTQRAAVAAGAGVGALLGWEKTDDLWGAGLGALAGSYITLVGVAGASGALNKLMRHQAFAKLDLAGKGVALEAALIRHQRLAQSPAGIKDITRRYGEIYGDQLPQLLDDLKQRKITEPVRSLAWMELSREQPISKLERSQAFLDNPNARGLWMLKNWMAKQIDLVRRDAYDELKKRDKESVARGLRNLTAATFVFGLAGMPGSAIKDWILGREVNFEAGDVLENTLKTFGWSEYTRQKMKEGHPVDTFLGIFAPPWQIMDRIIEQDPKAVMHIPLAGRIYEARELGGNERNEIFQREIQRKRMEEQFGRKLTATEKKQYLPPLSPAAKLYRQQLKEQRNGTR